MKRFGWLMMLILLVGSFIVAWSVHQSSGSSGENVRAAPAPMEVDRVAAQGHVDVDKGIVQMYPRQPGLVTWVAEENQKVQKGDVLLQVDDSLARLQVEEASVALIGAEASLRKAELQVTNYPYKLREQQGAVTALEHAYKKVQAENETREKTLSEVSNVTEYVRTAMKEGLAQLDAQLKIEKEKLEELKANEAELKYQVKDAGEDVKAKKIALKKSQEALELYKIRARSDGFVLRVLTQEGATLGMNPREPALQFRPAGPLIVRAEILQEWGHLIKEKQPVTLEDDTYQSRKWEGEVQSISQWYAPTRSPVIEPFKMNDVRTLECLIKITGGDEGLRIGQRVRVKIKV